MTTFEELLKKEGKLIYKTRGVSMLPMLHQNRDLVVIVPQAERLKKYDVALYRRGSSYVLHRVIDVKNEYYLIRGDNTFRMEKVPDSQVIGVLIAFVRNGKQYKVTDKRYQIYVRLWNAIYPLRSCYVFCRRMAVRAARKMGILPIIKKVLRR